MLIIEIHIKVTHPDNSTRGTLVGSSSMAEAAVIDTLRAKAPVTGGRKFIQLLEIFSI